LAKKADKGGRAEPNQFGCLQKREFTAKESGTGVCTPNGERNEKFWGPLRKTELELTDEWGLRSEDHRERFRKEEKQDRTDCKAQKSKEEKKREKHHPPDVAQLPKQKRKKDGRKLFTKKVFQCSRSN